MNILKNLLITTIILWLPSFFVYSSFVFGTDTSHSVIHNGESQIKKSIATIETDDTGNKSIKYTPYQTGTTSSGILSLDLGRLTTAFAMSTPSPVVYFSGSHDIMVRSFQGILSFYDPFVFYTLHPADDGYSVRQITNGSFYIADEPDGTVSIYSIDIVAEISFFYEKETMTSVTLFPGMYIRFDPLLNSSFRWIDSFRIMQILNPCTESDTNCKDAMIASSQKNTGWTFVNPRMTVNDEEIFLVSYLPIKTKTLFQMLHLLFRERINQVNLIRNYQSTGFSTLTEPNSLISNPSKKNYYLLDELNSVLSKAVLSQMNPADFRIKIQEIDRESKKLIQWNSVQQLLEKFLTDARFVVYGGNVSGNKQFDDIYAEIASVLGIIPDTSNGKFFQALSDIYSRNIIQQRKDPTFSWIDTYTPTASGLKNTLGNTEIASNDFFDIALYAYQILQKTQDKDVLTPEALSAPATYALIETLFGATDQYVRWLTDDLRISAYQALVIQFYAPIAKMIAKSVYANYTTSIDTQIYLWKDYFDGGNIRFNPQLLDNLESTYHILNNVYNTIAPLADESGDQQYALSVFRDSILRIDALIDILRSWKYREYQKAPYIGVDIDGVMMPSINPDGGIEIYQPIVTPAPVVTDDASQIIQ